MPSEVVGKAKVLLFADETRDELELMSETILFYNRLVQ